MFKRSFLLVLLVIALVFLSALAGQLWRTHDLPSSYDPGLSIEKAFKTSSVPLLVEFYSDGCGTCKRLAPIIHELARTRYAHRLTLVMLDINEEQNQGIAQLFGVDALPALYVFDAHHMKKHPIPPERFVSESTLTHAIDAALI